MKVTKVRAGCGVWGGGGCGAQAADQNKQKKIVSMQQKLRGFLEWSCWSDYMDCIVWSESSQDLQIIL